MNSFWDRIKHKNVVKVATAYGIVCWILLQIQDAVLPTIGAPLWVAQIILFIILIGFPIACLIAWASESSDTESIGYDNTDTQVKLKKDIIPNRLFVDSSNSLSGIANSALKPLSKLSS